jgi:hypothetical protein
MLFYKDCIKHADKHQTKKHLWRHEYRDLIRTARLSDLIQESEHPSKGFLVESIAELSFISGENHG